MAEKRQKKAKPPEIPGVKVERIKTDKTPEKKPGEKAGKADKEKKVKALTQKQKAAHERKKRREEREAHKRELKLGFRCGGFTKAVKHKTKRVWCPSKTESNKRIEEKTQQCQLSVFDAERSASAYTDTTAGAGGSA